MTNTSSPSSFWTPPNNTTYAVVQSQTRIYYYGELSTAPTADPFGNAILTGAAYFNTNSNTLLHWNGSTWA